MKASGKIAFAGVICALSVTCMLLTVIPTMEIGLPALAGCLLVVPVIELGVRYGFLCYATTAALSIFLAPSLESKMLFVVFFGYYPVMKALIERLRSRILQWALKIGLFNITVCGAYWLLVSVLSMLPKDDFVRFGAYVWAIFILIGNAVFLIYDIALTRIISLYLHVLRSHFRKMFHF